ncbi:MAG TPA: ATP-binding protein, partial [Anaerolineae bacterium]|nr:ATP-binding protein [Anaerolineae bacterium]
RHQRFAGRAVEQALFQSALTAAELPFYVLYIFGPGGVGKTSLLNEFAYRCYEANLPVIQLDARNVEPSPESFLSTLQLAMGLTPPESPLQRLAEGLQRRVILVDTYEKLASLDPWLREVFLPQLPEDVLIVLAGQHPPLPAWSADSGWQSLVRILPLRNFTPAESRAYLTKREIPTDQHQAILDFTYGHPLALSLVADVFAQRGDTLRVYKPEVAPDVIKVLLEQLVQKVPGPAHRAALEACALVHLTTETLLAAMLGMPDVHELFEWLRSLSCIESGPIGLFPHDLARETLAADLRWRNPDWYAELHHRARTYYASRLQQVNSQEQQAILAEYLFLHRDNPVVRPFFMLLQSQPEIGSLITDVARDPDWPILLKMVQQYEGEEAAHLASFWFSQQPGSVLVLRDAEQQPAAFIMLLALHRVSVEDLNKDPAAWAAWQYLQGHAPLRPGEGATLFRFWMAHDTYQAVSAAQGHIFIIMVQHYLTTPGLAFTFLPCRDPNFWLPIFAYADLARLPEADFEVGGQRYGMYGHDWRVVPPVAWLDLLAEREISTTPHTTPPPVKPSMVVLSRPEFEEAVRNLLRDFRATRPESLRYNPLLWSRLVVEQVGVTSDEAKRVTALQAVIKEAAEQLHSSPRQKKFYQALHHTYFYPAPTQEQAAELLDLPFSTFRRHLKTGMTQLTQLLWQREIGGLEK